MSLFVSENTISTMRLSGPECLTFEQYVIQSQEFAFLVAQDFMEISDICNDLTVAPHWILNIEDDVAEDLPDISNVCDELTVASHWILNIEDDEEEYQPDIANICDELTMAPHWVLNMEEPTYEGLFQSI
jgi:hypothetical protein